MTLRRRLLALLFPVVVFVVVFVGCFNWLQQQEARATVAEAQWTVALNRAAAAETRAGLAEASLTAIAVQQLAAAGATATVVARATEPRDALTRALGRVFGIYQNPSAAGLDTLRDLISPAAIDIFRPEADYLRSNDRHLGGDSTFTVDPSAPVQKDADTVDVHTHERWLYDERDASDKRFRCFVEDSDQTYTLKRSGQTWLVDAVQLAGSKRTDC